MDLIEDIKNKIYTVRGVQVMLDRDLAKFYQVETKRLNEQVKRNIERFPSEFMFQLNEKEFENLRSQFATSSNKGGRTYLPYVFTEQGVAMLAGILNSKIAVKISIDIINAFVKMRRLISKNSLVFQRLDNIEKKQLIYDDNFDKIFDLLENKDFEKKEGIFFEGQVFDAYVFICSLVRKARGRIILIDNYIDESILEIFTKNEFSVNIIIYTKNVLKLDLEKLSKQYSNIQIKENFEIHDRFLVIDNEIYHIGASLKDLGRKLFAFSKLDSEFIDKIIG